MKEHNWFLIPNPYAKIKVGTDGSQMPSESQAIPSWLIASFPKGFIVPPHILSTSEKNLWNSILHECLERHGWMVIHEVLLKDGQESLAIMTWNN
jgi:hypothetical protein